MLFYGETLADDVATPEGRRAVQAELAHALMDGPGIVVFKQAFEPAVVDRASAVITSLIEEQKARGVQTGDHFAKPGSNDRLWSALEKLAVTDPETFVDYFANDVVNLASVAWLGPNYQIVSDPNVVNPGGTAQTAHRDYHLGFMDLDLAAQFPAHVHRLSPVLTLQGAVAHVDMPVETGPTMYLPHSQKYQPGYMAIGLPEFQEYFERALRAAAAGEGRRGVLQPGPAARRGHQPDHGRQAHGEPAAGVVGVRPGAGHGRHRAGRRGASTRRCAPARPPGRRRRTCTTSSPRPRRATPSRRTWTATSRSAR